MTKRTKFLKAMRREIDGYVPMNISLCPAQLERFEEVYGHRDVAREWDLPHRYARLPFRATASDYSKWLGNVGESTEVDAWGIGHETKPTSFHFSRLLHPLEKVTSVKDLQDYPFPLPAGEADVADFSRQVKAIRGNGHVSMAPVTPAGGTVFWPAYKLRGMENLLCDMYEGSKIAHFLLDKVTEISASQARLVASASVDILLLADDLGTQQSTFMSPKMFRDWIKPSLAIVISEAKRIHPEILVHFHSDGAVQPFIPDLLEVGVDILNPVQPECMDPFEVKRLYGTQLSMSGCIGTQTTLPFGSVDDVRGEVRRICDQLGRGGGLWIAPTHLVEPEVPWENVEAFVQTASEYALSP